MASISPSYSSTMKVSQSTQPKKQVDINLETLEEWCGIQPDDLGMGDWLADKKLPPVDANKAMDEMDLETSNFEESPPVQFTFRSAVRLVVAVINRNAKLVKEGDFIPLFCPAAGGYLLQMLCNVETKRPDLIPEPPLYGGLVCSAQSKDHRFWPGVVLQMLYEQGRISGYGRKGTDFWVCI